MRDPRLVCGAFRGGGLGGVSSGAKVISGRDWGGALSEVCGRMGPILARRISYGTQDTVPTAPATATL